MKKTKFTKQQLENYRQILLETQYVLAGQIQSIGKSVLQNPSRDASGDLTNLPTHIADLSADTFSQNLSIELLENGEAVMKDIADALERVDKATYGICEKCQKQIAEKRLEHIPYTRLCVTCKSLEEKSRNRWK